MNEANINFYTRHIRSNTYEAWVELNNEVVCSADILIVYEKIFVERLYTREAFRRRGFATYLVSQMRSTHVAVLPVGILDAISQKFWHSLENKILH